MELVPVIIAAIVGLGAGAGVVFAYDKKNKNGGKILFLKQERKPQILLKNQKMKRILVVKIGNKLKNVLVNARFLSIINLIRLKNVQNVFLVKKRKLKN